MNFPHRKWPYLLTVALLLAFCLWGGHTIFVRLPRSSQHHEQAGDAFLAKAEAVRAYASYTQAYEQASDPVDKARVLVKMAGLSKDYVQATFAAAIRSANSTVSMLEEAKRLDAKNLECRRQLLSYYLHRAELLDTREAWAAVYRQAIDLRRLEPGDALVQRAWAVAGTLLLTEHGVTVTDEPVVQPHELRTAHQAWLERQPADLDSRFYVALLDLYDGARLESAGELAKAVELRARLFQVAADAAVAAAAAVENPPVRDVKLARLHLYNRSLQDISESTTVIVRRLLNDAADKLLSQSMPEMRTVAELVRIVLYPGAENALLSSEREAYRTLAEKTDLLLERAIAVHGLQAGSLLSLQRARLAERMGQRKEAVERYRQIAVFDRPPAGLMLVQEAYFCRWSAADRNFDLLFDELAQPSLMPDLRLRYRRELDNSLEVIRKLQQMAPDKLPTLSLYIACAEYARGHYYRALSALIDYRQDNSSRILETEIYLGLILAELEQYGEAAEILFRLPLPEHYPTSHVRLRAIDKTVDCLLRAGKLSRAAAFVQKIEKIMPGSTPVALMNARMARTAVVQARAAGAPEEAEAGLLAAFQELDALAAKGSLQVQREFAELTAARGQMHEARELFAHAWQAGDAGPDVMHALLELDHRIGGSEAVAARLKQVMEAGGPPEIVGLIDENWQMHQELNPELLKLIELLAIPDSTSRLLALMELHSQAAASVPLNDNWLAAAERLDPASIRLYRLQLRHHLAAGGREEARRVLARAAVAGVHQIFLSMFQAEIDIHEQQYYRALELLDGVTRAMPYLARAWELLGDASLGAAFNERAETAYATAIRVKPDNVEVLLKLFALYDRQGLHERALGFLKQALAANPLMAGLISEYLAYESAYGMRQDITVLRQRLAEAQPENEENRRQLAALMLQAGNLNAGREILDQLGATGAEKTANAAALATFIRRSAGVNEAALFWQHYLAQRGEDAGMNDFLALARFWRDLDRPAEAVAAYHQAIACEQAPHLSATRELAQWLLNRGDRQKAILHLERVWRIGKDVRIGRELVSILIDAKQFARAEQELRTLQTIDPENVESLLLNARLAAGRGLNDLASAAFNHAIHIYPDDPRPYLSRAQTYFNAPEQDLQQRVMADLEKVLQLNPYLLTARELLLQWHVARRQQPEAIAQARRLMEMRPRFLQYRWQLMELLLEKRDFLVFNQVLTQARQQHPGSPVWHTMAARMWEMRGHRQRALNERLHALLANPEPAAVAAAVETLLDLKQISTAVRLLEHYAQFIYDSPAILALQARTRCLQGERRLAIDDFTQALRGLDSTTGVSRAVARQMSACLYPRELQLLATQPAAYSAYSPYAWLTLTRALGDHGATAEQIRILEFVEPRVRSVPDLYLELLLELAAAHAWNQNARSARTTYERVLEVAPDNAEGLQGLAALLAVEFVEIDLALSYAERALQLKRRRNQPTAPILSTLGLVRLQQGELAVALHELQRSLALDATVATTHTRLGLVFMRQGRAALASEQFAQAVAAARQAQRPTHLEQHYRELHRAAVAFPLTAWTEVATLYLENGQHAAAERILGNIRLESGYDLPTLLVAARFRQENGQCRQAMEIIESAKKSFAGAMTPAQWLQIGLCYAGCERHEDAIVALRALADCPVELLTEQVCDTAVAWMLERELVEDALHLCRKAAATDSLRHRVRYADALLHAERLGEAEKVIQEIAQKYQFNIESALLQIRLAIVQRQPASALNRLDFAASIDPNHPELIMLMASLRLAENALDPSGMVEGALRRFLTTHPDHSPARRQLAELHGRQWRWQEAVEQWRELLKHDPLNADAFYQLGMIFLKRHKFDEAASLINRGAAVFSGLPLFHLFQGHLFNAQNDFPQAVAAFAQAYGLQPTEAILYHYLAGLQATDNGSRAMAVLQAEDRLKPLSPRLMALAASFYQDDGQRDVARQLWADMLNSLDWGDQVQVQSVQAISARHLAPAELPKLLPVWREKGAEDQALARFVQVYLDEHALSSDKLLQIRQIHAFFAGTVHEVAIVRLLALALDQSGDSSTARKLFERITTIAPAAAWAWRDLARHLLEKEKDAYAAQPLARRAVELANVDAEPLALAESLDLLGLVQLEIGLLHPAQLAFKKSIEARETPANRLHYAQTLITQRQHQLAIIELRRASLLARIQNQQRILQETEELLAQIE